MNRLEYKTQMDRLIAVYGVNKYPAERIEMIFERVGSVDLEMFKHHVSYFIGASEKAPLLGDFVEALGSVLADARKREIEAKLELLGPCLNCNGTGHVTMYEKKTGWEYAFQCTCDRGPLLQSRFPKQCSDMGDEYASHRAFVAGRFNRAEVIRENSNRTSGKKQETAVPKTNTEGMKLTFPTPKKNFRNTGTMTTR